MARELYDDHFKAVESMPRGVVVTLRNISTQLESSWELHTNRQVRTHTLILLIISRRWVGLLQVLILVCCMVLLTVY